MNFTREPIIETVISPRDGMKLLVRSSKGKNEEYSVDSVEVVSFGQSLFFRSLERPRSFLVPVTDYEILELKEVRAPLKAVSSDRSIKIGGGKEQPRRESPMQEEREPLPADNHYDRGEQRKGKRRRGGRRGGRHEQASYDTPSSQNSYPNDQQQSIATESGEELKPPSFISKLFPPPPTLIKETLSRYKPAPAMPPEDTVEFEENIEEEILEFPEVSPDDLNDDEN